MLFLELIACRADESKCQRLYETYRDELTDAFLEQAFSKAVSARLERLPAEIPHKFSRRFQRRMQAVLRQSCRPPQVNRVIFLGRRTAAVLVAAAVLAFGTVMSVSAWREAFFEFVQEKFTDRSSVSYRQTGDMVLPETLIKYSPMAIPNGYELVFNDDSDLSYTEYYEDAAGSGIYFMQKRLDITAVEIDTETHDFEVVKFSDGTKARYLPNEGDYSLIWENDIYSFLLTVESDKIDIIKLAESTKMQNK